MSCVEYSHVLKKFLIEKEDKIMAPLQKRALYSLGIGLILALAMLAVFIIKGDVTTFDKDLGFRLIVYALWIGVPLVYLILVNLTLRKPKQIDERDRLIMTKAAKTQSQAVLLTLVIWIIVLTEIYWKQGQMPIIFLTIILISIMVISTLALSIGILIGYWRMGRNV